MSRWFRILFLVWAVLFIQKGTALSQIPAEVFIGDNKTSIDLMFFRFLKKHEGSNSRFMIFSRNRATIDYRMTNNEYLPQFGFVEAISYNTSKLKGFAPVALLQIVNTGLSPKVGIQYVKNSERFTAFGWVVSETKHYPKIDLYTLLRYVKRVNSYYSLFSQVESLSVFPIDKSQNLNLIQRLRLGLKFNTFQSGFGADVSQSELQNFKSNSNIGFFIRSEL